MNPEAQARQQIDAMLVASGWVVQDYHAFNPAAGRGIALREVPLKSGHCDYLLLVDRQALGVVEAKSIEPDDFDCAPFSQQGGLVKAHQLFGERPPELLDELNTALAAWNITFDVAWPWNSP